MSTRWSWLLWSAAVIVLGGGWMIVRYGVPPRDWISLQLASVSCAVGVAAYARVTVSRKRWLAAIVLVCVSPMAQLVYNLGADVIFVLQWGGLPVLMMVGGTIATVISTVVILVSALPPEPDECVARARVL
jgi:hypothetical protein